MTGTAGLTYERVQRHADRIEPQVVAEHARLAASSVASAADPLAGVMTLAVERHAREDAWRRALQAEAVRVARERGAPRGVEPTVTDDPYRQVFEVRWEQQP